MSKIIPYLLMFCLCSSGCSIIFNLDEVFTLEDYSHESDAQHLLVKSIDAHYDALTKAVDQGHIGDYKDEASFVQSFGQPILKKDWSNGQQRWLYRHAIYRLSKDKVYLYFDRDGKMIRWERLPCSKFL